MCLIIHKPTAKAQIPSHILDNANQLNPDGFGITYLDGERETIKTMDCHYARELVESSRPFVAHYRFATVGKVNKKNCHPFPVPHKGGGLFSNGTVASLGTKKRTDTQEVAELMGSIPNKHWNALFSMTETRFAYVKDGKVKRFGKWHELDGVYYSKSNCFAKASACGYEWFGKSEDIEEYYGEDFDTNSAFDDPDSVADWKPTDYLAVYGTLKLGRGNHSVLGDGAIFEGEGETSNRYRMQDCGIPYVYAGVSEEGHHLTVEVYRVPQKSTRQAIDFLEGHPIHYCRKKISITLEDCREVKAWVYFSSDNNPAPELSFIKNF